jgi:hypothetical protein
VVGFVRRRLELDALGVDRLLGAERVAGCCDCDVRRQGSVGSR